MPFMELEKELFGKVFDLGKLLVSYQPVDLWITSITTDKNTHRCRRGGLISKGVVRLGCNANLLHELGDALVLTTLARIGGSNRKRISHEKHRTGTR
jgi:hypothetical protein